MHGLQMSLLRVDSKGVMGHKCGVIGRAFSSILKTVC